MSVTRTDGELLRAADHDPHAFRVLYDRWAQPLLAFCYRRTCDPEASLDLVAETFAIAYQKRHRYRDRGRSVGAWLYGIAARELAAYRRRQRVELRACQRLAVTVPSLDDTSIERIEELVDAAQWRTALGEALAQLTTAERDAIRLRIIQQLDYPTVAERLCCSEQAARARAHRGLARLATTLGGDMTQVPALDRLGDNLEQAIARQQTALRRRRRRTGWLLAAATAIAVGVAIVLGLGPSAGPDSPPVGPLRVDPASAKVTVHKTAGFYEIRLANVLADPEAIREALRRRGLNVKIQFIPSSPSLVNKEVASYQTPGGDRRVRWSYRQASSVEGDLVTVRVPLDYRGELGIAIGRRVRPGEHYESAASSAQLPGEVLHCADVEGKRVRDIVPILRQRHLRGRWHLSDQGQFVPLERVLDWWVDGTTPWAPGEAMLSAVPQQPSSAASAPTTSPACARVARQTDHLTASNSRGHAR